LFDEGLHAEVVELARDLLFITKTEVNRNINKYNDKIKSNNNNNNNNNYYYYYYYYYNNRMNRFGLLLLIT
jgi:hypothetical protein